MKKEIIVASAITALLTSLSAESGIVKMTELRADTSGKIILSKDLKKQIGKNKKIGAKGHDKILGFGCNNNCDGENSKIGKKPQIDKHQMDKHPILKR